MNVIFLLIRCVDLSKEGGFYEDLAKEFEINGHNVTIITSTLRGQKTGIYNEGGIKVIRVNVLNSVGTSNVIKKGLSLAYLPIAYKKVYKKYLFKEKFDRIFMPTPPVTLINTCDYIKKKTVAKLYLILRDIHPECDYKSGYYKENLFYKFIYRYLYSKAQKSYRLSDFIGCMSPGNIEFVKEITDKRLHNKIVLLPNWVALEKRSHNVVSTRKKYKLDNKFVAIYGGNIGKAQDMGKVIKLANKYKSHDDIVFLIVGKGIRLKELEIEIKENNLVNVKLLDFMSREDYNSILVSADLGLILLDENYGAPTCPSKIVTYMSNKIPVLAMINKNSDYGEFYIDSAKCGLWSAADDNLMYHNFEKLYNNKNLRIAMGESGFKYYMENLTPSCIYNRIISQS